MPKHADGSISISTVGDLIDAGYGVSVYCKRSGCHHSSLIDLEALAVQVGRDHPSLAKDVLPYFRCSKCGSKDLGYSLQAPTPSHRLNTPSHMPRKPVKEK